MSPYIVEGERRVIATRGPLRLFRRTTLERQTIGKLEKGGSMDIISPSGANFGRVHLNGDELEVSPRGDVVLDSGRYIGFKAGVNISDTVGRENWVWTGTFLTVEDLVVRKEDNTERVIFTKVP